MSAAVLSLGGIYLFAKNTWTWLQDTIQSPTPLWATIALVFLSGVYIYLRISKSRSSILTPKPKYYKYCPDCEIGIDAKSPGIYCQCGTKYFEKCPNCNKKIIRDDSNFCSFCGYEFPPDRYPVS
ncbi:MAG: zinc-ribbon domain-containing protein [Deltaproteobacteria bacterium]|nr:zinc-ribbon domain-containing protein [Deltaproteobacteria bacterium]MBW2594410.1 zinc-ribbon domain-containing protein [Deltaproteobacteria bacterium]